MKNFLYSCLFVLFLLTGCTQEQVVHQVDSVEREGDSYLDQLVEEHGSFLETPKPHEEEADYLEEEMIITYDVNGDTLANGKVQTAYKELQDFSLDKQRHEEIWSMFKDTFPRKSRAMVKEFGLFTDGKDNSLGFVEPLSDNSDQWQLAVDYQDVFDKKDFYYTLVHEFGHLLTLSKTQVPPTAKVELSEDAIERAMKDCQTYYALHGCSKKDSYMNQYYNAFWVDIHDEWLEKDVEMDEEAQIDFLNDYPDEFLTDYAVTHPEEDIAEAWTYFVFSKKPKKNSIADQKILFFYNYPELVELRRDILKNIGKSL